MNETMSGSIFIAIGVLTMVGAALNWGIVSRSGKLLNLLFGDSLARVIYFVAGVFLFIVGIGKLIGANWL